MSVLLRVGREARVWEHIKRKQTLHEHWFHLKGEKQTGREWQGRCCQDTGWGWLSNQYGGKHRGWGPRKNPGARTQMWQTEETMTIKKDYLKKKKKTTTTNYKGWLCANNSLSFPNNNLGPELVLRFVRFYSRMNIIGGLGGGTPSSQWQREENKVYGSPIHQIEKQQPLHLCFHLCSNKSEQLT